MMLTDIKLLIYRNKNYLLIATAIYIIGFLISVLLSTSLTNSSEGITQAPHLLIKSNMSTTDYIENNGRVVLYILSGAVTFGITSVINLFINGLVLGAALTTAMNNDSLFKVLLLIAPHGIFEIPAFWISGATALKVCHETIEYFLKEKKNIVNKQTIHDFIYLSIIAFLLIIFASFVEANITYKLAHNLFDQGSSYLNSELLIKPLTTFLYCIN